jgi:hypothetical protein
VSLLDKLTIKPLLWAIAALLLLAVGQFVLLQLAQAEATWAQAERDTAKAELATRTTERDAFKGRVADLEVANAGWKDAFAVVQGELAQAQQDLRRLDAASRSAIAAAKAAATDADRTLAKFVAQFATESRRPDCAKALATLEAACPALSTY